MLILAADTVVEVTSNSVQLWIALVAVLATGIYQGIENYRTRKKTEEINVKVTSNHGRDTIGSKVDELVERVAALESIVDVIASSLGELRESYTQDKKAELAEQEAVLKQKLTTPLPKNK